MPYPRPPERFTNFFVSAGAGVVTVQTLLPALGANYRYRLVHARLALEYNATGVVRVAIAGTAFANTDPLVILTASGTPGGTPADHVAWPAPGAAIPLNNPLRIADVASLAAQEYTLVVYYYIDEIS